MNRNHVMNGRNFLVSLFLMLAISSDLLAEPGPSAESILQSIADAETLHGQAAAEHHGWVMSERLIKEAREKLAAGELVEADRLAGRAVSVSSASVAQAKREQAVWSTRVP